MSSKRSSKGKRCTSLTLKQNLKVIKLSENSMSKTQIGYKMGLVCQKVCEVVNAKEKILKEIKNGTPVNTQIIRKQNSFIAGTEKMLVVWVDWQTSCTFP